jgi:hypothetical protein
MFVTVELLLYGTQGKRERKENDRASVILHNIRCSTNHVQKAGYPHVDN